MPSRLIPFPAAASGVASWPGTCVYHPTSARQFAGVLRANQENRQMMTKPKKRTYRFMANSTASLAAREASSNRGAGYAVTATTERGARRKLARFVGKSVADEMYVCHIGD